MDWMETLIKSWCFYNHPFSNEIQKVISKSQDWEWRRFGVRQTLRQTVNVLSFSCTIRFICLLKPLSKMDVALRGFLASVRPLRFQSLDVLRNRNMHGCSSALVMDC